MQVHRSKGVTTLKLTKRERDTLKAACDLAGYIARLPDCSRFDALADEASDRLEKLLLAVSEKETVEA